MTEGPWVPQVVFRMYRDGQLEMGGGYLVYEPDGSAWAFLDEETIEQNPVSVGALLLDPMYLKEQPQPASERRLFLYRLVLNAPR